MAHPEPPILSGEDTAFDHQTCLASRQDIEISKCVLQAIQNIRMYQHLGIGGVLSNLRSTSVGLTEPELRHGVSGCRNRRDS